MANDSREFKGTGGIYHQGELSRSASKFRRGVQEETFFKRFPPWPPEAFSDAGRSPVRNS
jgi:hypothetical protein